MTRQALNLAREVDEAVDVLAALICLAEVGRLLHRLVERDLELVRHELRNLCDLGVRQVEHAPNIADGALRRHRAEGDDLRNVVVAVALLDVVDDLAALDVVEVDVDIRHRHALRIQEALKEQIVLQRVEVRDAEQIGDDAARGRTAPRADADAVLARVVDEIPDNEEVAVVAHAMDDAELVFKSLAHLFRNLPVAARQVLLAEVAQIRFIVGIRRRDRVVRQLQLAEGEVDLAARGNLLGVGDGLRKIRKECRHLLRRFQIVVVAREAHAVGIVERLVHLDAEQDVVELAVLAVHVMQVVRRDEPDIVLLRKLDECGVCLALLRQAVVLHLEEKIIAPEDLEVFAHERIGMLHIVLQDGARYLAGNAGRQADDALVILAQEILVDARLVVHALDVGQRDELDEIAVARLVLREQDQVVIAHTIDLAVFLARARGHVDLAADDGLHALLLGFLVEIDDAVHGAVIGDGDAVHAELFRRLDELLDAARTVEQAVFRVDMEVGKRHAFTPSRFPLVIRSM